MNKKLKNLKRRWRKIGKGDRIFYRGQAIIIAFNLLILPFAWTAILTLFWVGLLTFVYSTELARRRITAYRWYLIGAKTYYKDKRRLMYRNAELEFANKRLNSDYNKLKYECNQLKKSFCDIQNKRSINPKIKKKK